MRGLRHQGEPHDGVTQHVGHHAAGVELVEHLARDLARRARRDAHRPFARQQQIEIADRHPVVDREVVGRAAER